MLWFFRLMVSIVFNLSALLCASPLFAATDLVPKEGDAVLRNFRFHTGEVMPELRLHYTSLGSPEAEPVLILHGTGGSGRGMLNPTFADALFGPGQPLDAQRYFIILPDAIGTGQSSKPSDGLRASFPRYNYDDMVLAQYRLVTEVLGLRHLRLVLGNSMGGMQTWLWGEQYPDFMDALVPMASQPIAMSGRNWMMRRMIIDAVRQDPDWQQGNYTTQPKAVRFANAFFNIATIGGSQAYYKAAPTRALADKLVNERLAAPFVTDANDYLYQWESSGDYDPGPQLDRIKAALLVINSADDERNPTELGVMDSALKRIPGARYHLIPASPETRGHGTTMLAKLWATQLQELLLSAPKH